MRRGRSFCAERGLEGSGKIGVFARQHGNDGRGCVALHADAAVCAVRGSGFDGEDSKEQKNGKKEYRL